MNGIQVAHGSDASPGCRSGTGVHRGGKSAKPALRSTPPFDFAGQVIRIEAEKLARRHGLDIERVRRIMARTATDAYCQPLAPAARGLASGTCTAPLSAAGAEVEFRVEVA